VFAAGCFEAILGYPVGGVYFIPIIALYCGAFTLTIASLREFVWKCCVGVTLLVVMFALSVPEFFRSLYGYSVGSYFFEAVRGDTKDLFIANFMVTIHGFEFRALIVYIVSFATVIVAALKGSGGLRRLAIAALVCEAGIVIFGSINAIAIRAPIGFGYAEIAHSPIWVSYFVLAIMVLAIIVDRRLSAAYARYLQQRPFKAGYWALNHRSALYVAALVIGIIVFALGIGRQTHFAVYPPGRPLGVQLIEREAKLEAGKEYGGTVFTLIQPNADSVDQSVILDVVANHYRKYLGNDFLIDLPALDIPTLYQHEHWNSPIQLAFLRSFFARPDAPFNKAYFTLPSYDAKIARLVGIRIVVTDDKEFSDGTLIHEQRVGDADLRIFRIDNVNLGQYSPT